MDQRTILCRNCQQARDHDGIVCRHLFLILLHTALDFANGMIAEHTNTKEPISDEVSRAEAWPGISREMVPATPR